jgi:putative solute:sodium symporter small subunit
VEPGGRPARPGDRGPGESRCYAVRLTVALLAVWAAIAFGLAGLLAGPLDGLRLLSLPLGHYVAAQGALLVFVAEAAAYAYLMNRREARLGRRGDPGA